MDTLEHECLLMN